MRAILRKAANQTLLSKVFIVIVLSMVSVTVLTSWVTVQMSQKLFVETFSITNSKIIEQMKSGFETIHDSILNASIHTGQNGTVKSFLTEGDADSLSNAKAYFNMADQMKRIQSGIGSNDIGIFALGVNGRSYMTDRACWPGPVEELLKSPISQAAWNEPGRLKYYFIGKGNGGSVQPCLAAIRALPTVPGSEEGYGTLYLMIKESEFKKLYAGYTSKGNDVLILDQGGTIVSSNRSELIGTSSTALLASAKQIEQSGLAHKEMKMGDQEVIVLTEYLPTYELYIVNVIDKTIALGPMLDQKAIALICTGIVAAALLIVYLITRRMTQSLRLLVRRMSNVTKRDFQNYMPVAGNYETRELSLAFNYMLDELNEYINRLVDTQNKQRNAELAALQQQINPHFLYNTLASVNILVQRGSKEKAAETIYALISLLQNTISNVKETITAENELQNLKHYVFINQVRYGDGIKVDYFVSPECLPAQVPKLIIQPFIENAFFHAFNKQKTGYIYVIIAKVKDTLLCEVVDNGDGMKLPLEDEKQPNPTSARQLFTGIGIRNVHDRILLLYGDEYGVSVTSSPGEGTKVAIKLPWRT